MESRLLAIPISRTRWERSTDQAVVERPPSRRAGPDRCAQAVRTCRSTSAIWGVDFTPLAATDVRANQGSACLARRALLEACPLPRR